MEYIRGNPHILQNLVKGNPPMAQAVMNNDLPALQRLLNEQEAAKRAMEAEKQRQIALLNADPFNVDAQLKIADIIREENVQNNYEQALEHNPESFGRVVMLYVDCEVNGHPLKAFIDSGAQSTIMSVKCAERCGIMHLVDRRFAGIARGVGTAKIHGRVHIVPLKLGNQFFSTSFTILEGQDMDFLLGLDNLKKFQMAIDLRTNVLRVGEQAISFLAEKDLPLSMRGGGEEDEEIPTPALKKPAPSNPPPMPRAGVPAPGSAAPAPVATTSVPQSSSPNEESIRRLMDLGFARVQAVQALAACNGNAEMAASFLFQM
jgi:DNA damage-inducible protein 1